MKEVIKKQFENDGSVNVQIRNILKLATEMLKVFKNLSTPITSDLFEVRENNYNLRNQSYFLIPTVKTVYHGSESIKNLGPRVWNLVPDNLKQAGNVDSFKTEIKNWIPGKCPCRLCKTYIPNVGFT